MSYTHTHTKKNRAHKILNQIGEQMENYPNPVDILVATIKQSWYNVRTHTHASTFKCQNHTNKLLIIIIFVRCYTIHSTYYTNIHICNAYDMNKYRLWCAPSSVHINLFGFSLPFFPHSFYTNRLCVYVCVKRSDCLSMFPCVHCTSVHTRSFAHACTHFPKWYQKATKDGSDRLDDLYINSKVYIQARCGVGEMRW